MPEITAVKNGGFPEPLGGHGIRLVDSRHDECGHSTRVRLPLELSARAVRRVICEQCGQRYVTTRVDDYGVDEELAELNAAVSPPAPAPASPPPAVPAPAPAFEPPAVTAPPAFAPPPAAAQPPAAAPPSEPVMEPEIAPPAPEPEPSPNPFTSSAPIPDSTPYELPAPAPLPVAPAFEPEPTPTPTVEAPVAEPNPFMVPPTAGAESDLAAAPSGNLIPAPEVAAQAEAPASAPPPSAGPPLNTSFDSNAPASAPAKQTRKTAIGPEIKLPSFKRKPKAVAPAPAAPSTDSPAKPKRKTAVGPEIKVPSFKRKPKAVVPAAGTTPGPVKPKRRTAIGPEIKLPSFNRKPKAPPAEPLQLAAPRATRRTAIGPELTMPSFNLPDLRLPSFGGGGGIDFGGTSWRRLSIPIAGGAVIIGLLLLRGGGDSSGGFKDLPTRSPDAAKTASQKPGSAKSGTDKVAAKANTKNAEVVAGANYSLALPKGWERINPTGGATFAALASDGSADATLWIKRDPTLDFATFEANSLAQLKDLGGSSKVIDQQQGPSAEQTVVTLGTDAPKGAPAYQVVLRSSGSYFYYLATTLQPGASSASVEGVKLLQDSLLPTGSSK